MAQVEAATSRYLKQDRSLAGLFAATKARYAADFVEQLKFFLIFHPA